MHRRRFIAAVSTGTVLAGSGLGIGLSAAAATAGTAATTVVTTVAAAAAAKSPGYVVLDCAFKTETRPVTYVLTCADAGMGLERMHWTSWTARLASGYGSEWENTCVPSCAAGHLRHYPVLAVLWGSARVKGHPAERRYTELTLIYTGPRPPVYELVHGKLVATHPATQTFPAI